MTKTIKKSASESICNAIVDGMQDNKAQNIVVLDLRKIDSSICDFFVICTGESSTQVEGITDSIARVTRKKVKEKPWHIEGKSNKEWVLLDYVTVVAHVFYKEVREFYQLEELWSDAIRRDVPNLN